MLQARAAPGSLPSLALAGLRSALGVHGGRGRKQTKDVPNCPSGGAAAARSWRRW